MHSRSEQEHTLLHLRIDQLERRLAKLEKDAREAPGDDPPPHARGNAASALDSEDEGARLVVIEMLTAGYRPDQISTYLRQTFEVEDAEALIAEARPLPG